MTVIEYSDVLSSEVFIDGNSISKTSRKSQLGGALVGGVVLGGVGAIIGGLSGAKTSSEMVSKIELRIIVNNTEKPIHDLKLLQTETKKNSSSYDEALAKVRHWHGILEVAIKHSDSIDRNKLEA